MKKLPPKKTGWRYVLLALVIVANFGVVLWLRSQASNATVSNAKLEAQEQAEDASEEYRLHRTRTVGVNLSDDEYREEMIAQDAKNVSRRLHQIESDRARSLPKPERDGVADAKFQLAEFIEKNKQSKPLQGLLESAQKQLESIEAGNH